ncbi:SEED MATURATION PROTEIN 1 [Ricinus communis]|uniref:Seed maturation protein n=1 Tax=Ricinus communis TaxID=3988 RepID=B9RI57_RICCO|nr:SEED MATURATION PROTEIN 1 [Ricinus communis]EEF48829.1 conserved hypothetical protein [Ricinus communis]|eukprot:XP_002513426.1 uncharacterized protein LOC8272645 [Ricinus communis]
MAKSKDDIKYGTAQAKLSDDEAVRVRYKHGTPLEGGKIADSEPVDLFSSAHNISSNPSDDSTSTHQSQLNNNQNDFGGNTSNPASTTTTTTTG